MRTSLWIPIPILSLALSACGLLAAPVGPPPQDVLATQIAQTLTAQLTQLAPTRTQAVWPATQPATSTPEPATATSTLPPPTPTSAPATPTAVPPPCDAAGFVGDVTIADGTTLARGAEFVKTWRLKNVGTCTWDSHYDMVFTQGTAMTGQKTVALTGLVRPGETVDLSVALTAPDKPGGYRGYWMLRNSAGVIFGLGSKADQPFWVDINVGSPTSLAYDFSAAYCQAEWSTTAGDLPCPGVMDDPSGFVLRQSSPNLEFGQENEPGLLTHPERTREGTIRGEYPPFQVQAGDRFTAVTACLAGHEDCEATFRLEYRLGRGPRQTLKSWQEIYDGRFSRIEVDLSSLAGETVQFTLAVEAAGPARDDYAFWLGPSIWRGRGTNPGTGDPDATRAAEAARLFLAGQLGVHPSLVTVTSVEGATWHDTCLGIPLSDDKCTPVSEAIRGFRVMLDVDGRPYEAHTNRDGSFVFWRVR